jgi:hypothetical protein
LPISKRIAGRFGFRERCTPASGMLIALPALKSAAGRQAKEKETSDKDVITD